MKNEFWIVFALCAFVAFFDCFLLFAAWRHNTFYILGASGIAAYIIRFVLLGFSPLGRSSKYGFLMLMGYMAIFIGFISFASD
jgi:hypothetical protein